MNNMNKTMLVIVAVLGIVVAGLYTFKGATNQSLKTSSQNNIATEIMQDNTKTMPEGQYVEYSKTVLAQSSESRRVLFFMQVGVLLAAQPTQNLKRVRRKYLRM
ncbi:MAG: hypothetical protein UZ22_OP11002000911 [Microgenomates bacterium OLB23]|nr:MAG: hypothetical protein UZ22_OP11002000911 [Microgenomates bacterium OLB23]